MEIINPSTATSVVSAESKMAMKRKRIAGRKLEVAQMEHDAKQTQALHPDDGAKPKNVKSSIGAEILPSKIPTIVSETPIVSRKPAKTRKVAKLCAAVADEESCLQNQRDARTVIFGGLLNADMAKYVHCSAKKVGKVCSIVYPLPKDELGKQGLSQDGCKMNASAVVFTSVKSARAAVKLLHQKEKKGGIVWARQLGGEGAEVQKWKLVVRNLPFKAKVNEIKKLFSPMGFVWDVNIPPKTGFSGGCAFVKFTSKQEAETAISKFNGQTLDKRSIAVDWADDDQKKRNRNEKKRKKRKRNEKRLKRLKVGKGKHGCRHYRRRCRIRAPCCDKIFKCRHCHNKSREDTCGMLVRSNLQHVICALCNVEQEVSQVCWNCGVNMGEYFCSICNVYDDDETKNQFHCDGCGICRVNGSENSFHCDTCGGCLNINIKDSHTCIPGHLKQVCSICFQDMFDSHEKSTVLDCGHAFHADCVINMELDTSPERDTCPQCAKPMFMEDAIEHWNGMDELVKDFDERVLDENTNSHLDCCFNDKAYDKQRAFDEVNGKVKIYCESCWKTTETRAHVVGLRCVCGSYLTRRV